MDLKSYLEGKKSLQSKLLKYIEDDVNVEENYTNLIKFIQNLKIAEDRHELRALLYLISKVSNNHHRVPDLFSKMEQIIKNYEDKIKQTFSNSEIFEIFRNNKKMLLFLVEHKILKIDKPLSIKMILPKYVKLNYPPFFLNEIAKFYKNQLVQKLIKEKPEDLEEKRKICENDSPICEIIRKDSIEDFKSFVSSENLQLSSKVKQSFYETNPMLLKNEPTLIEYAAFHGSIQIIKYLQANQIELPKSLWLYAIHSQNIDLIHFLEENHVESEDGTFESCVIEAIKCHHNDIAIYIQENLLPKEKDEKTGEMRINRKIRERFYSAAIHYYNYFFFDSYFKSNNCLVRFAQYDYYRIVEITSIGGAAEKNHFEILNLLLAQSSAKISKDAFKYCTELTEVEIPANIQTIQKSAFKGCSSLQKVKFSNSLTTIEDHAFDQCSELEEITIPSSVINMGRVVFQGCTSLKKVTFEYPSKLEVIGSAEFSTCSSLKEIKFPSSLKIIEKSAFSGCSSLKNIYFPPSVTEIGEGAFGNCTSLKKASFSNGSSLTIIKDGAFRGCSSLIKIKFPPSLTSVGDKIFENCTSLTQILIPPSLTFNEEGLPDNAKVEKIVQSESENH